MNVATCPKPIYTFLIYVSYQIIGGSTGYLFDVIFFMCMCGIFTCRGGAIEVGGGGGGVS